MSNFQFTRFNYLPPAIKNLLILNGLVFLATVAFPDLIYKLGLYYPTSPNFQPYQKVTHLFTHGDFGHVFFNMFALWMFGSVLENVWGPKRFLIFYFVTGLGAAALHMGVNAYQIYQIAGNLNPMDMSFPEIQVNKILSYMGPTVGASGAVYGILIAFGMLFPNTLLYIYFLLPIKAKYLVIILIAIELYLGFVNNPTDNVAHFAHLGGALFGFFLVKYWGRDKRRFY